jgi:hypothetical protein
MGFTPQDIQSAYGIPSLVVPSATVAIVDAFDDPNIESDLAVYRSTFNLPACTSATGCFTKVGQSGSTTALPPTDTTGWSTEMALDVDMVSAACPQCKILLVEANSAQATDLAASVNTAVSLGANAVSCSFSYPEWSGQTALDADFTHPGVGIFVSTGDGAYPGHGPIGYPSSSPSVTAVGGTTLMRASNARGWTETVWDYEPNSQFMEGPGSGCSLYEPKPRWQTDLGCSHRTAADVSAVADPGVAVYETFAGTGWIAHGMDGTSVATPIVASIYTATGHAAADGSFSYLAPSTAFNDVTAGTNARLFDCEPAYLCNAEVGYDGPTGNGSPWGTAMAAMNGARASQWPNRPDFNGDGRADTITTTRRRAYVHYGSDQGIEGRAVTFTDPFIPQESFCGRSAVNLGDTSGDGIADLGLIGCYTAFNPPEVVIHQHFGNTAGLQWLSDYDLYTGFHYTTAANVVVVGVGDVNRDGYGDVLVGEIGAATALLFSGGAQGLRNRPVSISAPSGSTAFGVTAGPIGDVNGDGYADFLIGSASNGYVFLGAAQPSAFPSVALPCASTCPLGGFGDVNGDGLSDVLLSGDVFLGQRSSPGVSATPVTQLPAGEGRVADFDRDGFDDVLLSQSDGSGGATVRLYPGSTSGVSTTPSLTLTPPPGATLAPGFVVVGDVNDDLMLDVAFRAKGNDRLFVYFGQSSLSPTVGQTLAADERWALEQDFNGDGRSDLLVNRSKETLVQIGTPTGFAGAPWVTLPGSALNLGDVNGDGISDLGVQAPGGGAVQVYFGDAWGVSATASATVSGPAGDSTFGSLIVAVGDVEGDGFGDILVGDPAAQSVKLYPGDPAGLDTAGVATIPAPSGSQGFGVGAGPVGDINGDGYDDFIVTDNQAAYVFLGAALQIATSPAATIACAACVPTGFGDFNGDGFSDFVLGGRVYSGQSTGAGFNPVPSTLPSAGATAVGDFDGDGFDDLLLGRGDGSAVLLYKGATSGLSTAPVETLSTPTGAGVKFSFGTVSDVDGDGFVDAPLWTGAPSRGNGRVFLFKGGSGSPGLSTTASQALSPNLRWDLHPDFNGDGYSDLLVSSTGSLQILSGSAAGLPATVSPTVSLGAGDPSPCSPHAFASLGDVNGDGFTDVGYLHCDATVPPSSNARIYLGGSEGIYEFATEDVTGIGTASQPSNQFFGGVGDVNGDGYGDVIWSDSGNGKVYVRLGEQAGINGPGIQRVAHFFVPPPNGSVGFGAAVGPVGDVNGDGYDDFVVADSQNLYLYLGVPGTNYIGNAAPATAVPCGGACVLGGYGDVNSDGYSDFVVSGKLFLGQAGSIGINPTPIALASTGLSTMADFDSSGSFDLLQTQAAANDVTLSLGGSAGFGSPIFTLPAPSGVSSGFGQSLGPVGDFNGDGLLDAVIWSSANNIYVYLGTGTGFGATPANTYTWNPSSGI